jgi:hypothetical protein
MTRHQWAIAGTAAAALAAAGIATRSAVRRIRGDLADIRSIVVCEAAWLRDLADTVDAWRQEWSLEQTERRPVMEDGG